jgi:hypothetical protein
MIYFAAGNSLPEFLRLKFYNQVFMLKDITLTGQKDNRSGSGEGIVELAGKNSNFIALTADLGLFFVQPKILKDLKK